MILKKASMQDFKKEGLDFITIFVAMLKLFLRLRMFNKCTKVIKLFSKFLLSVKFSQAQNILVLKVSFFKKSVECW